MATINCKVVQATEDEKGTATIVIEFDDGVGKWEKIYKSSQTTPVDLAKFKEMLIADLRKDLQIKGQLSNISSQVGKKFTLTI